MSDMHDNTRPAKDGSFALSKYGVISYFPIERSAFLKPSMALVLHMRHDGELVATIDMRMDRTDE